MYLRAEGRDGGRAQRGLGAAAVVDQRLPAAHLLQLVDGRHQALVEARQALGALQLVVVLQPARTPSRILVNRNRDSWTESKALRTALG